MNVDAFSQLIHLLADGQNWAEDFNMREFEPVELQTMARLIMGESEPDWMAYPHFEARASATRAMARALRAMFEERRGQE